EDVDQVVIGVDLHPDVRIGSHEAGQDGRQRQARRADGDVQPERADWASAQAFQSLDRRIDLPERRTEARDQQSAGFSWRHAAGGPMEKPQPKPRLEAPDGVAQRRGADARIARSIAKTAGLRDCEEGLKLYQVRTHCSTTRTARPD